MENTKKVPERQCVGCRAKRPKSELIRIVRPAESQTAELDRTGKKSGRGAYICPSADCLKKARKRHKNRRKKKNLKVLSNMERTIEIKVK